MDPPTGTGIAISATDGQISLAPMAASPGPWPARIAWAALPLTVAPVLGSALDERSLAVARTASGLAWLAWAGGLFAVAVPRTVSLTALRILVPLLVPVSVWAAVEADGGAGPVVAVTWAALAVVAILWPPVAEAFADGSSYGDERRMLLRTPTPLVLGPLPLTWLACVAGPVAGPLLLAARAWAAGAVVLLVGLPLAVAAARVLHGLSRRWVVFVPAGFVLHDLQAMGEAVLFPRREVVALRVAPAGDDGVEDLTLGTLGGALQLDLAEPLPISPRRGRIARDLIEVQHLRFAPARPGELLAEAARRRIGTVAPDR
jgi:hypothetical protein